MSDFISRLKEAGKWRDAEACFTAADEIIRLRAELAECRRVIDLARHSVAYEISEMQDKWAGYLTDGRLRELEVTEKLLSDMHAALAAKGSEK